MHKNYCPFFNVWILFVVLLLAGCSTTKFVAEDAYLLDKVEITCDRSEYNNSDLGSYLRQRPNFKVFGVLKWPLYVYNWSSKNPKNWFGKQFRRIGEAPILLDTTKVELSAEELRRYFVNKGFPDAEVQTRLDTSRKRKAIVYYDIITHEPYRIKNYNISIDDVALDSIAHLKAPSKNWLEKAFSLSADEYNSLVKDSSLLDRDMLDRERQRVMRLVRNRGYYAFNRDHLAYLVDTSSSRRLVDVDMKLKPYRTIDSLGVVHYGKHHPYTIKNVTVITDYNPLSLSNQSYLATDTVYRNGLQIVYGKNGKSIRSKVLANAVSITPGKKFSEHAVEQTYSAFANLHSLRNINVRFDEVTENDSLKLNCKIYTSPAKKQSFGIDVEGTNSAGDLGFATSLNYEHRNLFKGSELFSSKIRGAYESLKGSDTNNSLGDYWEIGAEASILFPRFVFPFISSDLRKKLRASSELNLSYNLQTRPEYTRAIVSGGWSYIWQNRGNSLARHTFNLLDIDYVFLPKIEKDFLASLPTSTALYNYTDQFIAGIGYTYSFSNYNPQYRMRNTHSLRVALESAGNFLYLASSLLGSEKNEENRYELFGINYSQFIKADVDFSKGLVIDERNKMAFHIGVGVGFPYANGKQLPFERRYFGGGANGVRGWSVRTLGPGIMKIDKDTPFVLQTGDIRLNANLEYRTKLFWKFELAAYMDAGNIWTVKKYDEQPEGNFDFKRFYKEIAASYGLGLRIDFDFFLLRFDTGMKAYNPQATDSDKWAFLHPNLKDNFAWHFAVGYPF